MVMETVQLIMQEMGSSEVDSRLEEQLIDGNHKIFSKVIFSMGTNLRKFQVFFMRSKNRRKKMPQCWQDLVQLLTPLVNE